MCVKGNMSNHAHWKCRLLEMTQLSVPRKSKFTVSKMCDVFTLFDAPAHPYTKSIVNSVEEMKNGERLKIVEGNPPSILDLPSGCKFHPRCNYCQDICRTKEPEYKILNSENGHMIKCHYPLKYDKGGNS